MELADQSPTSSAADVNKLSGAIHPIPKSPQEQLPCSPHDAYYCSRARWHRRDGAGDIAEVLRPHVHEIREILDTSNISLGLEAVFKTRTGGLQRWLQSICDDVVDLSSERRFATPVARGPDVNLGVEGAVRPERHVAGDEDEIVRRHC